MKKKKLKKPINKLIKGLAGGAGGTGLLAWALIEIYNNLQNAIRENNESIQELIHLHLR